MGQGGGHTHSSVSPSVERTAGMPDYARLASASSAAEQLVSSNTSPKKCGHCSVGPSGSWQTLHRTRIASPAAAAAAATAYMDHYFQTPAHTHSSVGPSVGKVAGRPCAILSRPASMAVSRVTRYVRCTNAACSSTHNTTARST
jgi:hypothetical protein